MKRIKGQVLFLRGLSYYNLVGYYQNPPLITDYATYSSLDGLYTGNSTYDAVLDQVESDFKEAMELLPSRDQGGEWEKGRATCGAAAGYYARALMVRHKFKDALTVLKDIIGKKYGTYELMAEPWVAFGLVFTGVHSSSVPCDSKSRNCTSKRLSLLFS